MRGDRGSRVALITGGASGIGAAVARRLRDEGVTCWVADVDEAAQAPVARRGDDTLVARRVDVCDSAEVDAWVAAALDRHGRIDALVCAAGIFRDARVQSLSDTDFDAVVGVNLKGTFTCTRAVSQPMIDAGHGRIVTFASVAWKGNFGQTNYAASKAGVVGLTRSVALELGRYGVTANVVSPGLIDTPMLARMNVAVRNRMARAIPAGRLGDADEVAAVVSFLVGPAAGYVNGAVIDVDGGLSVGIPQR